MRIWLSLASLLLLAAIGCKDSGAPEEISQVAIDYCAVCSEFNTCERLVTFGLNQVCSDELAAWYTCATDNATENGCDFVACDPEWQAREACIDAMIPEPEQDGGAP